MRQKPILGVLTAILIFSLFSEASVRAQERLIEDVLNRLTYRNLGPFRAGSWVTSFAVPDTPLREHLYTFYVGTRNGGVWKTANAGTTFEPVFDDQEKLSIGDVAVAPSNPDIVWVGTGEAYCARSSHAGDGLYKSTDAGKTWTHMGLRDSHHIARIVIHPHNPDIVYVAAMGHLFSNNAERGVFRTTDGGQTWAKVLYINDKIGAIELGMVKSNPDVLYAAMYDKVRLPWHYEVGGPESAIYKTTDAGETWTRLADGLPSGRIGRIGFDIFQKNPDILYAVVENANLRPSTPQEIEQDKRRGIQPRREREIGGEVFRTDDGGKTWRKVNEGKEEAFGKAPYSFNQLRLDQNDPNTLYITAISLVSSVDGGKTWTGLSWPPDGVFQNAFGDWRAMWVDPQDSDHLIFGSDGGVYISHDRGKTCQHCYNIPLGEFYAIGVDMEEPYNIYGGLQDHDSWKGPSNGWTGEITLADWVTVGGGDGMYNQIDPTNSRWLYNNREFGAMWRFDQKLGIQTMITPRRDKDKEPLRFNWTPPIALSSHNPAILYVGAQVVFRSEDRGDHWTEISPDLTTDDESKQHGAGHISFCTLTSLAESPVQPGVIWTGADDGKVQVTKDGGKTWLDRTAQIEAAGGPDDFWVSRVFPSPHDGGTCFVAKTGLRFDDFQPFLFKTTDYGETWTSIASDLPADKSLNVVVQDHKNPNLLFVGTEQGVYVTLNGGKCWLPFKSNMPWVKVTDLIVHPRENDLVVGTYGRGLFVTGISILQELNDSLLRQDFYLFDIEPKVQLVYGGIGNYQLFGDNHLITPNEPNAVVIRYFLKEKTPGKIKVTVADASGQVLRSLEGAGEAGLNTVLWDMRAQRSAEASPFMRRRRPIVAPGEYNVILEAFGKKYVKKALIRKRMGWAVGPSSMNIK